VVKCGVGEPEAELESRSNVVGDEMFVVDGDTFGEVVCDALAREGTVMVRETDLA
jgi:hypothetical protein